MWRLVQLIEVLSTRHHEGPLPLAGGLRRTDGVRVESVEVQVQGIGDAGCGIGDPDLALADLGGVVLEPDARRDGEGGSSDAVQPQVVTDRPAVERHLASGRKLVVDEVRGRRRSRHGVDRRGY